MGRPFDLDDVVGGRPPGWRLLVLRGLMRRCARCGGDDVFASRWRLRDRCPDCGYRFVREPGFNLGAWFLNFMLVQFLLLGLGFGFILWSATGSGAGLWPALGVGAVVCVVVPIAFYPTSRTLWAAIDLGMTPLELDEIVDAADAISPGDEEPGPDPDARGTEGPDGGDPDGKGSDQGSQDQDEDPDSG